MIANMLLLAKEIARLQDIEEQARKVIKDWEEGLIVGKPEYESYCQLDIAILRDKVNASPDSYVVEQPE